MLGKLKEWLDDGRLRVARARVARTIEHAALADMDAAWIESVRTQWANEAFAARASLLNTIVSQCGQLASGSVVVEIGSGLTTLLLRRICALRGAHLTTLEHHAGWKATIDALLGDDRIVRHAPLRSHGDYDWYELPSDFPSAPIDLLVVDGPPEKATPGGRYGLVPVLGERITAKTVAVIDDFRPEKDWIRRWEREHSAHCQPCGELVALMSLAKA